MTPLIKCEHVDFGYDNQDAVVDVDMEVNPGDYLCIVGENGSGKSTLMKGLLGLLKPPAPTSRRRASPPLRIYATVNCQEASSRGC